MSGAEWVFAVEWKLRCGTYFGHETMYCGAILRGSRFLLETRDKSIRGGYGYVRLGQEVERYVSVNLRDRALIPGQGSRRCGEPARRIEKLCGRQYLHVCRAFHIAPTERKECVDRLCPGFLGFHEGVAHHRFRVSRGPHDDVGLGRLDRKEESFDDLAGELHACRSSGTSPAPRCATDQGISRSGCQWRRQMIKEISMMSSDSSINVLTALQKFIYALIAPGLTP